MKYIVPGKTDLATLGWIKSYLCKSV